MAEHTQGDHAASRPRDPLGDVASWPTGRLLSVAARLVEHRWLHFLDQRDLTHAGLIALHVLARESLPQRQLAARCRVTDQTISRIVDRLERATYVHRRPDPADRRRVLVSITPMGTRVHREAVRAERESPTLLGALDDYEGFRAQLVQMVLALGDDDQNTLVPLPPQLP